MAVVRKKQDDNNLKALRELVTTGAGNRQCFDCDQKGPTYVNMTIGSFVCTRCSGVLRGLTPPHRIKSISMATFTQDEIDFLKTHGNEVCAKTWLGLWDPKRVIHQDHRELMVDKYERKRYYLEPASPLKSLTNTTSLKQITAQNGNNNFVQTNINGKLETTRPITNGYVGGHNQRNTANTFDNNFHKIQLTPPTSQRSSVNRQHKTSSSTAIIRPQQHNGTNQQPQHQNAFGLCKEINGGTGYTTTGPLSDINSSSSNSFATDSDFVADFGTANIFDASTTNTNSIVSTNGYAKIQPIKKAHELINVSDMNSKQQRNGTAPNSSGNIENFADFEHAPIYNSAENYQFISKAYLQKTATVSKSENANSATPSSSRTLEHKQNIFPKHNEIVENSVFQNGNCKNNPSFNQDKNRFFDNNSYNYRNDRTKSTDVMFSENISNFIDPFDDFDFKFDFASTNNYDNVNCPKNNCIVTSNKNVTNETNFRPLQKCLNPDRSNSNFKQQVEVPLSQFEQQHQKQELKQQSLTQRTQLTSLAMAAHATAMAVLGNSCHFNNNENCNLYDNYNNNEYTSERCEENNNCTFWNALDHDTKATEASNKMSTTTCFWPYEYNVDKPNRSTNTKTTTTNPFQASSIHSNMKYDNVLTTYNDPHIQPMLDATTTSSSSQISKPEYCEPLPMSISLPDPAFFTCLSPLNPFRAHFIDNSCNLTSNIDSMPVGLFARSQNFSDDDISNFKSNSNSILNSELKCDNISSWSFQMPNKHINAMSAASNANNLSHNISNDHTNNNQVKTASNPSEDRYAALKHLDEQLRESKAVADATAAVGTSFTATGIVDTFGYNANNANNNYSNNPSVNPFQTHNAKNLYGQMPLNNCLPTNDTAASSTAAIYSYTNGLTMTGNETVAPNIFQPSASTGVGGPNGCGFGFGAMQQQIASTGGLGGLVGSGFNNPFTATGGLNSNNPFL